jgi:predicted MFS family arabinose efflux permease
LIIVDIAGRQPFYVAKGLAFLATALSLIGVVWVLAKWKPAERKASAPGESILGAAWKGVHYASTSPRMLAIMSRIFLFMVFAGILQTSCAGICKENDYLRGETGASYMMACFGIGAIIGVYLMQAMQRRFGVEQVVVVCTILYGAAMLGVAKMTNIPIGCAAMFVAGFNWVIVPTNFNIATQLAVPAWIKGRAMGVYVLVLWGSMSLGSMIFGRLASVLEKHGYAGQRTSLFVAGLGVIIGSIFIIWLRLVPKNTGAAVAMK